MSGKLKSDPDWRRFQDLIALIERHLCPKGAVVRSPDYIADKVTGQLREVDASIRYQVGSIPILVTIECRDRSSPQDVTWIEQLASKRESIGASATVAVSSSRFSVPALKKSRARGIETRQLREVSEDAIRAWAEKTEVILIRSKLRIQKFQIRLKPTPSNPNPVLHPLVQAECVKGDIEYKFLRRASDGKLISIGDLLRDEERKKGNPVFPRVGSITVNLPPFSSAAIPISAQFSSLFDDVPVNAPPVTKNLTWAFDPNEATAQCQDTGQLEVERLSA